MGSLESYILLSDAMEDAFPVFPSFESSHMTHACCSVDWTSVSNFSSMDFKSLGFGIRSTLGRHFSQYQSIEGSPSIALL